ncbi:DNA polymerase III, delta subunit [Desulfofarcimen acetoxidans DSM 771]|uniref:DNA polymerase III subunit delta n=1 Tax=Desulfofarcimen acetoxidans (strain ATCC 49208 / DSM 771 / KCTC 5769 / VKM B-1644 / 5575) TaxID=485916 RepID=C8W5J9_DESAS|nr:DNA polymerase III subunit delta [Desulfofarcimen acetoxidans]ACV63999.1 DNA polymerase III, delta subunit [Desulfofarcimen acetoxidans DSM 771]
MEYFKKLLHGLKNGEIKPVYLLYGQEVYLLNEAIKNFKKIVLNEETGDFNFDLINGEETTPEDIVSLAQNLPFMAEKRLVVVKDFPAFNAPKNKAPEQEAAGEEEQAAGEKENISVDGKGKRAKSKSTADDASRYKALLQYIEKPSSDTCLLFTFSGSVDKRKKLVQAINKTGEVIDFVLLKKQDLRKWLLQQAKKAGKTFQPEALELFLTGVKNDLYRISAEVKKLFNYTDDRAIITKEDIEQVVISQIDLSIFAVADAIGEKRCSDALRGIRDLLLYREPPQKILVMIYRQFRLLFQYKALQEEGDSQSEIQAKMKLHPYVAGKIARQAKNFSIEELYKAMYDLSEIDAATKSGQAEFCPAIEMMLIKVCSEKLPL